MRGVIIALLGILLTSGYCLGATIADFDDIPINEGSTQLPGASGVGDGPTWAWSLRTDFGANRDRWTATTPYASYPTIYDQFFGYAGGVAGEDRTNYGFYESVSTGAYSGNSLRFVGTGGQDNSLVFQGQQVRNKSEYLSYSPPSSSHAPVPVGNPYLYFVNGTTQDNDVPMDQTGTSDRLEFYVKMTPETSVGSGGYGVPVAVTMHIGTFEDNQNTGDTSHWYHYMYINGGAWVKMSLDNHPTWHNAGGVSGPGASISAMASADYMRKLFKFYIAPKPYKGPAVPPHYTYFDEIQFVTTVEQNQNNETINSPAVGYWPNDDHFEIGFSDKYGSEYSRCTYEVRYSFAPITNTNWASATPIHVNAHTGFAIDANTNGWIRKWWPYYKQVWASFNLSPADRATFQSVRTIYFAVKDVSQDPTDYGEGPYKRINPALTGNFANQGRVYITQPASFVYAVDVAALPLIKTISYTLPGEQPTDTTPPSCSAFALQSPVTSLSVPVSTLTCEDNVEVTGYYWSESATPPTVGSSWQTIPSSITVGGAGSRTVYLWSIDAANNISVSPISAVFQVNAKPPSSGSIGGPSTITKGGASSITFQ